MLRLGRNRLFLVVATLTMILLAIVINVSPYDGRGERPTEQEVCDPHSFASNSPKPVSFGPVEELKTPARNSGDNNARVAPGNDGPKEAVVPLRGRSDQAGFDHRPARPFVVRPEHEHTGIVPMDRIREVYGVSGWPRDESRLIGGIRFSPAKQPEFESFEVVKDDTIACFSGPEADHGVVRNIEFRRKEDRAQVSIRVVVALSVAAAQEQFLPVVRIEDERTFAVPRNSINTLSLGDVNVIGRFANGDANSVAFSRKNIYFSIVAKVPPSAPIADFDVLKFAQFVDEGLALEPILRPEELEQLRPAIRSFDLGSSVLDTASEKTNWSSVQYFVLTARNAAYRAYADGTGDLLYDDRAKPSRIRGSELGQQTARLVVIDEYYLFTWADRPVQVK